MLGVRLWRMMMVVMAGVLEGHVGGDHLAGHASSIVEGVVGHSILCPASGLADNKRISEYHHHHHHHHDPHHHHHHHLSGKWIG